MFDLNLLRGGSAGGGISTCKGLDMNEVLLLEKTTEIKFIVFGSDILVERLGIKLNL